MGIEEILAGREEGERRCDFFFRVSGSAEEDATRRREGAAAPSSLPQPTTPAATAAAAAATAATTTREKEEKEAVPSSFPIRQGAAAATAATYVTGTIITLMMQNDFISPLNRLIPPALGRHAHAPPAVLRLCAGGVRPPSFRQSPTLRTLRSDREGVRDSVRGEPIAAGKAGESRKTAAATAAAATAATATIALRALSVQPRWSRLGRRPPPGRPILHVGPWKPANGHHLPQRAAVGLRAAAAAATTTTTLSPPASGGSGNSGKISGGNFFHRLKRT